MTLCDTFGGSPKPHPESGERECVPGLGGGCDQFFAGQGASRRFVTPSTWAVRVDGGDTRTPSLHELGSQ
jgi:hypothetical protein